MRNNRVMHICLYSLGQVLVNLSLWTLPAISRISGERSSSINWDVPKCLLFCTRVSAASHHSSDTSFIRYKVPEERYLENLISCKPEKSIVSRPDNFRMPLFQTKDCWYRTSTKTQSRKKVKLKSLAVYCSTIICSSIALKNKLRFLEEIDEKLQQWMIWTVTGSFYWQRKDSWDISLKPGGLQQGTTACLSQKTSPHLHNTGAILSACLVPQPLNIGDSGKLLACSEKPRKGKAKEGSNPWLTPSSQLP